MWRKGRGGQSRTLLQAGSSHGLFRIEQRRPGRDRWDLYFIRCSVRLYYSGHLCKYIAYSRPHLNERIHVELEHFIWISKVSNTESDPPTTTHFPSWVSSSFQGSLCCCVCQCAGCSFFPFWVSLGCKSLRIYSVAHLDWYSEATT